MNKVTKVISIATIYSFLKLIASSDHYCVVTLSKINKKIYFAVNLFKKGIAPAPSLQQPPLISFFINLLRKNIKTNTQLESYPSYGEVLSGKIEGTLWAWGVVTKPRSRHPSAVIPASSQLLCRFKVTLYPRYKRIYRVVRFSTDISARIPTETPMARIAKYHLYSSAPFHAMEYANLDLWL